MRRRVYRDDANAHSGDQVGFSFCPGNTEAFDPSANISGQILNAGTGLGSLTDSISLYAGAPKVTLNGVSYPGGQVTTLTAFNTSGGVVKSVSATVGSKANTLLSITSSSTDIAYFTVSGPADASVPLEIDDLSFEVPATPPPPQIALNPVASGFTTESQGQTLKVPVTIDRYSGADDPVTLAVSGLPDGVSLTGGQTIAAGSDSADLTFSIAANAQVTSHLHAQGVDSRCRHSVRAGHVHGHGGSRAHAQPGARSRRRRARRRRSPSTRSNTCRGRCRCRSARRGTRMD